MKTTQNSFLNNSLLALYAIVTLCLCTIIFDIYDNYAYSKNGVETQGSIISFTSKNKGFTSGRNNNYASGYEYPVIRYIDSNKDSTYFVSSYSYSKLGVGEQIAIRYIPNEINKVRINTFSINWLFSIFAGILLVVCSVFILIVRFILKNEADKELYMSNLAGKTLATVIKVEKYENGWNLILHGNIPETNNSAYTFVHFTMFESEKLVGQSFEVCYNPADIEGSYIFDIEHTSG